MAYRNEPFDRLKKDAFLRALQNGCNVVGASKAAKVSRKAAYKCRKMDPEFAAAWEESVDQGVDNIEQIMIDRAKKGSDTLLMFYLKSHRPDRYRERSVLDIRAQVASSLSDEDLQLIIEGGSRLALAAPEADPE